ncbi:MAG: metal dependent phosphohydrolase [Eubacterium sp.]|nr:metal dependent phosphohydrolase [Eubacterium sp.]
MRYLTIDLVQEGMRVGKTIFNEQGVVLLNANAVLTRATIDRLEFLGYKGLIIEDEISEDIEYNENFVSNEVKFSLARKLNNAILVNTDNKENLYKEIDNLKLLISDLINEMLSKREINLNLLELKMFDNYTYFHSVNVAIISLAIAYHLKMNKADMLTIGTAALLHDIGKIYIGTEILNKPGSLTEEEFEIMKTHSKKGYDILSNGNNLSVKTTVSVLSHHEHYDGSGYPNGLTGENIILSGRIICIADVYDALTSDRPYRKGCSVLEATEYIMANSGSLFDPELVALFISKVNPYPVGSSVRLSNGEIGIVVNNSEKLCLRPTIKIIEENRIVDLFNDKDYLSIVITGLV